MYTSKLMSRKFSVQRLSTCVRTPAGVHGPEKQIGSSFCNASEVVHQAKTPCRWVKICQNDSTWSNKSMDHTDHTQTISKLTPSLLKVVASFSENPQADIVISILPELATDLEARLTALPWSKPLTCSSISPFHSLWCEHLSPSPSQSYWSLHTEHSEDFLKGHCWWIHQPDKFLTCFDSSYCEWWICTYSYLVGLGRSWLQQCILELNYNFSFNDFQWHVRRLAELPHKDPRLQALSSSVWWRRLQLFCADPTGVHHRRPAGGRMRFFDLLRDTEQRHWGGTLRETYQKGLTMIDRFSIMRCESWHKFFREAFAQKPSV